MTTQRYTHKFNSVNEAIAHYRNQYTTFDSLHGLFVYLDRHYTDQFAQDVVSALRKEIASKPAKQSVETTTTIKDNGSLFNRYTTTKTVRKERKAKVRKTTHTDDDNQIIEANNLKNREYGLLPKHER